MPKRKKAILVEEVEDSLAAPSGANEATAAAAPAAAVAAAATGTVKAAVNGSGEGAAMTKQERKRLKKQRQKEEKQRRAERGESGEKAPAAAPASTAAADAGDIDDIFGASKKNGSGQQDDGVGTIPIYAEGDGDGYVSDGEGGVVARDMDDLEQIFAERRAKAAKSRANAAAAAATKEAAEERDAYVTGKGGKNRRLVDGLAVYTEDEVKKSALTDVKGTLDGPCPFDCACCF